ncbi:MAG: hypothetical protein AAGA56_15175 [Myxococcota bacterium]
MGLNIVVEVSNLDGDGLCAFEFGQATISTPDGRLSTMLPVSVSVGNTFVEPGEARTFVLTGLNDSIVGSFGCEYCGQGAVELDLDLEVGSNQLNAEAVLPGVLCDIDRP